MLSKFVVEKHKLAHEIIAPVNRDWNIGKVVSTWYEAVEINDKGSYTHGMYNHYSSAHRKVRQLKKQYIDKNTFTV